MTLIIIFITAIVSVACFRNRQLFNALSLNPYRVIHNKEWYRVITHIFVHGDIMHLAINMLVLLSFGQYIENLFKAYQQAGTISSALIAFLGLYFLGGIVASISDLIKQRNNPYYTSIGASGAVAAVIFASIFFNPWSKIYLMGIIPIPGLIFGILYLLYTKYMAGKGNDNINHYAHLYGALFGFIYPMLLDPSLANTFLDNLF